MALPKINESPKYTLSIPSTEESVKFRPFLVKEQKVLLMALESQDNKQILDAIIETIKVCVDDKVNVESLSTFDLEYIFTMIRAKSVGEVSKVSIACSECDHMNEVSINLEQIEVTKPDTPMKVDLGNNMIIGLRYPNYNSANMNLESTSVAEVIYNLVIASLHTLNTEEERILFDDEPIDDVKEFVDNLTADQYEKLVGFVNNLPTLKKDVEFKCKNCGHENERTLRGLQDFF